VNRPLNHEVDRLDLSELAQRCSTLHAVPVLVVRGQRDPRPADGVADLVTALPEVATMSLDAGHQLWRERPGELWEGLHHPIESADARQPSST
jgi:pimeloyl-ACP methyl ester carboxylesterase